MRQVLLLIPDLFFGVKVADTARALGYGVREVAGAAELPAAARAGVAGVVIDTQVRSDWQAAVRALKADAATAHVPVLAFAPHVDVESTRAAVSAGCDRIVTRGKLSGELPALLRATFGDPSGADAEGGSQ